MLKKFIIKAVCTALILSAISFSFGCTGKKEGTGGVHLKIGLTPAVDAIPYILAQDKGIFKKYGLDIELKVFKSAKDRDAAFQSSSIDGVLCDMVAVCLYQNAGFDARITGVTDGDFMLVAGRQSGIKDIRDIRGCQVAISENTVIEYVLDKILSKNNITSNEVKKVAVPTIPVRMEMLQQNKVQLALLPEPFSSMAIKEGAVVLDSAYRNNIYSNVIAFKQTTIKQKSSAIANLNEAYNQSVKYLKETPVTLYQDRVIKFIGYPDDMKGNIVLPDYRKAGLPDESELLSTIEWATKEHLLNKSINENVLKAQIK